MIEQSTQVIVAGGGPVGLMLACELRLAGVEVVVLERLTGPSGQSRALGLHSRTVEVFDQRGLLDRVGDTVPVWPKGHFAGMRKVDMTKLKAEHSYALMVPQSRTEEILAERSVELGTELRRGHQLTGLTQDADGVLAEVAAGSESYLLRAEYLVGCDGGSSTVRRLAGFDFPGTASTVNAVLGDVQLIGEQPQARELLRLEGGLFGMIPLGDDVYRVVAAEFDSEPVGRDVPVTVPELTAAAKRVSGMDLTIGEAGWMSRFGNATRLVDRYRIGRVLVAGDAAHVHFPAGGQGLNTGIQDCLNLGWKLAATVRGWAPDGLLDTYESERRPVAKRVCMNTRAQLALMHPAAEITPLRELFSELMDLDEVNTYLAEMITGLDIRYPMGDPDPAVAELDLIGRRLPPLLLDHEGTAVRGTDLLREGRGLLLDLTADGALADLATGYGDRLRYLAVRGDLDAGAVLVRPDGYVAWAGQAEPDPAAARRALRTWFGEPSISLQHKENPMPDTTPADSRLYAEIQDFYGRHMALIDDGLVDEWVQTFAPDATISNNTKPEPAHGREQIVGVIRRAQAELEADGIQHRHWMGMLVVDRVDDDTVLADSYAMIVATEKGGSPIVDRSTRCLDELIRADGDWQIRTRRVHHDGHPAV